MNSARKHHSKIREQIRERIDTKTKDLVYKRMRLAARIDDILRERGLTNQEFAFMLGRKPSEISRWLSGTHNFTTDTLWDIERVLNVQLLVSSAPTLGTQFELRTMITQIVEITLQRYQKLDSL